MDDVPPPYTRAYTTPVVSPTSTTWSGFTDAPRIRGGFIRRRQNRIQSEPSVSTELSYGYSLDQSSSSDLVEEKLIIIAQVITPDLSLEDLPYPPELLAYPDRDVSGEVWQSFTNLVLEALYEENDSRTYDSMSVGQFSQKHQVIRGVIDRWNDAFFEQRNIHIVPAFYYPKHLLLTPTGSVIGTSDADDMSTIVPVSSRGSRDTSIDRSRGARTPSNNRSNPWHSRSLDYSPARPHEIAPPLTPQVSHGPQPYIEQNLQRFLGVPASNNCVVDHHSRRGRGWGYRRPWGRSVDIPLEELRLSRHHLNSTCSSRVRQRSSSADSTPSRAESSLSIDSFLNADLEDPNINGILRDTLAGQHLDPVKELDMMSEKYKVYMELREQCNSAMKGATREQRHAARKLIRKNKSLLNLELKNFKDRMKEFKHGERARLAAWKSQLNEQVNDTVAAAMRIRYTGTTERGGIGTEVFLSPRTLSVNVFKGREREPI